MKSFPTMIGMLGHAGSGKDTTANLLFLSMLERADQYSLYALATPLKKFSSSVFNIPIEYFNVRDLKEGELVIGLNSTELNDRVIDETIRLLNLHYDINGIEFESQMSITDVFYSIFKPYEVERNWYQRIFDKMTGIDIHYKISPRKIAQLIGTEYFRDNVSSTFWCDITPKDKVIVTDVRFPEEYQMIVNNGGIVVKIENSNLSRIQESTHSSEQFIDTLEPDYVIHNDGVNISNLVAEVDKLVEVLYKNEK